MVPEHFEHKDRAELNAIRATEEKEMKARMATKARNFGASNNELRQALSDPVNHPSHYTNGDIECIDAIEASMTKEAYLGYMKGNTLKYLWRAGLKDDFIQDLKKAQWYLNHMIEALSKESNNDNTNDTSA